MTDAVLAGPFPRLRGLWPGLLLSGVVAVAATFVSDHQGGPVMLYALLIGMALNSAATEASRPGIDLAARTVLRVGVALLGARITLEQLAGLGWALGGLVVVAVAATIGVGALLARLLGVSRRLGVLTGAATAICGASAALAVAAVLPQDETSERELIFTVAGVTALSTLAMIAYPSIVALAGLTPQGAGFFLGGSIHDVAQVVGAGYAVSPAAGDMAVLTKLLRVAMLLPVVLLVSLAVRRRVQAAGLVARTPILPGFLVGFAVLMAAGSFGLIPAPAVEGLNQVSRACLVMAIAAVGLKTSLADIRQVGVRPMLLMGLETLFLAGVLLVALIARF